MKQKRRFSLHVPLRLDLRIQTVPDSAYHTEVFHLRRTLSPVKYVVGFTGRTKVTHHTPFRSNGARSNYFSQRWFVCLFFFSIFRQLYPWKVELCKDGKWPISVFLFPWSPANHILGTIFKFYARTNMVIGYTIIIHTDYGSAPTNITHV